MGFMFPTLKELGNRAAGAFGADLKGSDAKLYPNNVAVAAKVIAGAVWESFAFLKFISLQMFVHTSTDPVFIQRHAAELGMAQIPAQYATGFVNITGDASIVVPSGIIVERADGVRYEVINAGTTDNAGLLTLPVRALEPGRGGNAVAGVALTLVVPRDRINSDVLVAAAGIGNGADAESMESLRERVWFRKKNPPHGGAVHDYVIWARERGGITRVYIDPVNAANGRTTIGLWFLMDSTYPNGIPLTADVTAMQAYIDTLKPAGAIVAVAAPTPVTVNITITNLAPDTVQVRSAIEAELRAMFLREVKVSTLTEPFQLWRSFIREAIGNATGEQHHNISAPATDAVYTVGQIPVLGTISYA